MNAAFVVAAIGFGAAAFMLRFLIALLREGTPSVCYWVVPSRRQSWKEVWRDTDVEDDYRWQSAGTGINAGKFLGKQNYAKGKYELGLITVDDHIISSELGWRTIDSRHCLLFRERRPWFERTNRTTGNAG